ncbi:MAG: prolyl oligopeptidase family serine peptidase [Verrucomicrobia bacterium]|nr:prolyl oligopeptidase family serine peptidase [Verrucomicrobiota bacterium]
MSKHGLGNASGIALLAAFLFGSADVGLAASRKPLPPYKPTDAEKQQISAKADELAAVLKQLAGKKPDAALLADVEVYHKAADWILRYADEEFYAKRYVADTLAALDRGLARAKELATNKPSWPAQKGRLVRAYRSRVDGSVQPYGLIIPDSYDGKKPVRLDLVLHGRGSTLNEVSFLASHDVDTKSKPVPPEQNYITLEVFGRVNNAYRWAGETDVFEALESVQKRYKIDEKRIVLRGFSMGGAGAWHLGLHYPDKWAAVEAGAGFTDTKKYAKLDTLPPWQEKTLHIYDAEDYALNAFNVPWVAYAGEDDPAIRCTIAMREALEREGFKFEPVGLNWLTTDLRAIFLIGPKTPHRWHPESKAASDKFINDAVANQSRPPKYIRFVTYTTRYNRCHWLWIGALEKHYERAEVEARGSEDCRQLIVKTCNISRLTVPHPSGEQTVAIDAEQFVLPERARPATEFEKKNGCWTVKARAGDMQPTPSNSKLAPDLNPWDVKVVSSWSRTNVKQRGLQGPIDDAFMDSFVCVRPTGAPNNASANDGAKARQELFAKEFSKWMRGDVRVKDDAALTKDDIANHNLILFGDPASNRLIAQIADKLPIRWTKDTITLHAPRSNAPRSFSAADHVLVMIYPNPLNPRRYVVLNSGHTFGEKEFRGTNALLFPRLGDYAVLKLTKLPTGEVSEEVVLAGLFDEQWMLPAMPDAKK